MIEAPHETEPVEAGNALVSWPGCKMRWNYPTYNGRVKEDSASFEGSIVLQGSPDEEGAQLDITETYVVDLEGGPKIFGKYAQLVNGETQRPVRDLVAWLKTQDQKGHFDGTKTEPHWAAPHKDKPHLLSVSRIELFETVTNKKSSFEAFYINAVGGLVVKTSNAHHYDLAPISSNRLMRNRIILPPTHAKGLVARLSEFA